MLTALFFTGAALAQVVEETPVIYNPAHDNPFAFIAQEYLPFILVLLILLIVLLVIGIIYLVSTLYLKFNDAKRMPSEVKFSVSKSTSEQLDKLMKEMGESDRASFVRKIITEELTESYVLDQEKYISDVVSDYVRSPAMQDRLRYTIANILLAEDEKSSKKQRGK